jgi:TonB family protein
MLIPLAASLIAAWLPGLLLQAGQVASQASDCGRALSVASDTAASEVCQAEEHMKASAAEAPKSPEWLRRLEEAARHLRRAANLSTNIDVKYRALDQLAGIYDARYLDQARDLESVLGEMIALRPEDMNPVRRLARLMEDRNLIDAAEDLLIAARRRQPLAIEPHQMLAQFYVRRSTALQREAEAQKLRPPTAEGEPDADGVYRVGGPLKPPAREGVPQYPEGALAAQIEGIVTVEIVIDVTGAVVDAQVVRSIPELDEAALRAVRMWRFVPTMVNGKPVPVRMTTTHNFSLPRK